MPLIQLQTLIHAPLERVFDLARSIDLHSISTAKTREEVVGGRRSGLIKLGETVTWRATHLGIRQNLTSKITALDFPVYFRDEQVKGIFRSIYHEHIFEDHGDHVIMVDSFRFEAPFGIAGQIFNALFLTRYMKRFLKIRNRTIKAYAESDDWMTVLKS